MTFEVHTQQDVVGYLPNQGVIPIHLLVRNPDGVIDADARQPLRANEEMRTFASFGN